MILKLKPLFLLFFAFIFLATTYAQQVNDTGLDDMFYTYSIKKLDSRAMHTNARSGDFFFVSIPKPNGGQWVLELHNSHIISDHYVSRYAKNGKIYTNKGTSVIPTKGNVKGDLYTSASLTFDDGFIYGYIKDDSGYNYIEPMAYYSDARNTYNKYIIYNSKDVKPSAPRTCGVTKMHDKREELVHQNHTNDSREGECFEIDYAVANDFFMFQEFGSVGSVEAHAIGVLNDVQTNYDDEFGDELQFILEEQFTATTAADDPWISSTDAGTLLNDFTNWGPTGFSATHDIGSLWTDRDFDGSTIGIAWVGVVCTGNRYNCLQNFSSNAEQKRVMVAHEFGHNFSAEHDAQGSPFIMAPTVSTSTTWSDASIADMDSHVASRWCLSNCTSSNNPPTAGFTFDVITQCTVGEVLFTSTSTGSDLSYEWTFPGGTPSTSTEENPSVFYSDAGIYDATLSVTNTGGTDEITMSSIISIEQSPEVVFSYEIDGSMVSFYNVSQNAISYLWDFGDGETSTQSDPVHTYFADGTYTVKLTGFSENCDDVFQEQVIVIATPPEANFTSDLEEGCVPLTVQFTSQASANTDDFFWTFEGGNPATSNDPNPLVVYNDAGQFDVSLTVSNETGDDVIQIFEYINVLSLPTTDFSFAINGYTVSLTNESSNATSYSWDFGDGTTSTEENPNHQYAQDGTYTITLNAEGDCGMAEPTTITLTISNQPQPSFQLVSGVEAGCAPLTVGFENTSTNADSFVWTFEGGNPATSTEQNPEVTYTEPGFYDVSLTATNENGTETVTASNFISVFPDPTAMFSANENGLIVDFTNSSTDANSYVWDFGDGNTSIAQNPSHTYAAEGIYTVTLTVSNDCGTDMMTLEINNYTNVTAGFSADVASGCVPFTVNFTDTSSDNVTEWLWTFEGGEPATSTEQNPVVTYAQAGTYGVQLTVSNPISDSVLVQESFITVNDIPNAAFDQFANLFDVQFTNQSMGGDSYSWIFGDGNESTDENPTHTYAAEGTYDVILTVTNECGASEILQTVEINSLPTAGFTANNLSGCAPFDINFQSASSSNVTAWSWTFEGGTPATSTEENPTVTYDTPGSYPVQLVVTSPAGTDTKLIDDYVVVKGLPLAEFDTDVNGNVIGLSYTGDDATTIVWEVDGNVTDGEMAFFNITENGDYTVLLTVTNDCGSSKKEEVVTIDALPVAKYNSDVMVVCVGEQFTLIDNSTMAESKIWTMPGADPMMSNDDNPVVTYSEVGLYDIKLTVSNEYGESTTEVEGAVMVIDVPTVSFEGDQVENTISFTSMIEGATNFFWDFGDGNTSNENNPTYVYDLNGDYNVRLVAENQCGETIKLKEFNIVSNAVSEHDLKTLKVYPNPTQNILNIEINNAFNDEVFVELMDVTGKKVITDSFKASKKSIDVSKVINGIYLLKISSLHNRIYKKVVIGR